MIQYSIVTTSLQSRESLETFIKNFGNVIEAEGGYGEWMIWSEESTIHVNLYDFYEAYYKSPDLIKCYLNLNADPWVISVAKRSSSNDPRYYEFIVAATEEFNGFVDFEGDLVSQIYSNMVVYANEDGSADEETEITYEMPTNPVDLNHYLSRLQS